MPRRNYTSRRRRPQPPSVAVFELLHGRLEPRRTRDPGPGDCQACARPLPTGWKYPTHSRCRPAPDAEHQPSERNRP